MPPSSKLIKKIELNNVRIIRLVITCKSSLLPASTDIRRVHEPRTTHTVEIQK